jgi:hypothetical protein
MTEGLDNESDEAGNGNETRKNYLATRQVLLSADIRRIVCVDDGFTDAGAVDTDSIIVAVSRGEVEADQVRDVAFEVLGDQDASYLAEADDFAAQAQWLREHRTDLTADMWARLGGAAPEDRTAATTAQDPEALQQLRAFADEVGIEFISLNLKGWRTRENDLLAMDGCSLIFFDRNLSDDGGTDDEGEKLLRSTTSKYPPEKAVTVLFTHSVGTDGEFGHWQVMAGFDESLRDRALVIAKQRIRADPASFASSLKMAILAPRLRRVADRIRKGFAEKAGEAADRLGSLSPHVLHSLLVTGADREGAWGPDGLMAIASADLRRGVETYVRADSDVRVAALQIRDLSRESYEVVLPNAELAEYDEINRARVFDEAPHVNDLRLPVDTGDIFAFFDPKKAWNKQSPNDFWIVVLQRCDLTVRSNGKRSYSPPLMPLLRIATPSENDGSPLNAASSKRVKLFSSPLRDHTASEVRLAERRFAPSIALDACAFHSDGVSRIDLGKRADAEGLSPPWAELLRRSDAWAKSKLELYDRLCKGLAKRPSTDMTSALCGAVTGALKDVSGFSSVVDPGHKRIMFGVRRVARLREPYIQDVMERLSALSARTALDSALMPD